MGSTAQGSRGGRRGRRRREGEGAGKVETAQAQDGVGSRRCGIDGAGQEREPAGLEMAWGRRGGLQGRDGGVRDGGVQDGVGLKTARARDGAGSTARGRRGSRRDGASGRG